MSELKALDVVKANVDDVSRVKSFLIEAWKAAGSGAHGWTGATDQIIKELASEDYLRKLLSNPSIEMFLCLEDGRILGFAVNRRLNMAEVELAGVIVLEGVTGKGIGTRLVDKAKESAKSQGFSRIIVKTEVFNQRAIAFYEKEGFAKVGREIEDAKGTKVELEVLEQIL